MRAVSICHHPESDNENMAGDENVAVVVGVCRHRHSHCRHHHHRRRMPTKTDFFLFRMSGNKYKLKRI